MIQQDAIQSTGDQCVHWYYWKVQNDEVDKFFYDLLRSGKYIGAHVCCVRKQGGKHILVWHYVWGSIETSICGFEFSLLWLDW